MDKKSNRPELLCPAGTPEAFRAAIEGGADAIYMGGTAFNARLNAKNFTPEQMKESISLAHAYGVKVYITMNTLVYDRELDSLLRSAEQAYLCGADALIVADLGAAQAIRRRIDIPLHASTQASGHTVASARALSEMGFSRMVCAREMSRDDLAAFTKNSPIEAEVFVHGALCVCHSGQCLFSSLVGGRSGNRGECAQPCRLPFKSGKNDFYPLSLKDLSLARHVHELNAMGIASYKIEGRMKSPEYVRDVATVWRRLIDENCGADDSEMAFLASIFSRGGFTDGYYTKRIGKGMLGVRSDADKERSRALVPFDGITRKIPVTISAELCEGRPMSITVEGGERKVTVSGPIPEPARTAPLTKEAVSKNLLKLGGTPYSVESLDLSLDDGLMLPLSAINALRREAVTAFSALSDTERSENDFRTPEKRTAPKRSGIVQKNYGIFYDPKAVTEGARKFFDTVFLPLEHYNGECDGVILPPVIYDSESGKVKELLKKARTLGATHALVGNLGHLPLLEGLGFTVHGDLRLNIANSETAELLSPLFEDMILAPELTLPRIRDIISHTPSSTAVIYGRIPLMITEKCVGKELGGCSACESGRAVLIDRRGARFPVLKTFEHRSLIFNSLPTYMADRQDELRRSGIRGGVFIFTDESPKQVDSIISAYEKSTAPSGAVRRMQ